MSSLDSFHHLSIFIVVSGTPQFLRVSGCPPGSQTFATTSEERADEPVRIVGRLLEQTDLPEEVRGLEAASVSKAHLVSAGST